MAAPPSFTHLLAPGRIGPIELRNRIAMAPMGSGLAEADGRIGERITRYYEARAKGGAGLIIMGVGAIAHPAGTCIPRQVAISDDAFLPGLEAFADRMHSCGAKVAIQLQHAGKVATQDIAAGRPMWVPSASVSFHAGDLFDNLSPQEMQDFIAYLQRPDARVALHEMTAADIARLVAMFADAADRARRAGFDGVEIHAAHGYLIAEFLSPATNHRTDAYGGSLENRARLLVEVIRAVRERVGNELAVWCRLDGTEFRIENGITLEDAQRTAELAEAAGADAIHVSAYAEPTLGFAFTDAPLVHEPGRYVALAEGIKRRVKIPVIAVGRIEPTEADEIIKTGKADFVAMGRKLLADPELPGKLASGRAGDIRPCIYCYVCVGNIFLHKPLSCAVNPATGREAEFAMAAVEKPKRVLIVGGGPAGMEAARVAALRGHQVILCEKTERLGGSAFFASLVYEVNGALVDYLQAQVRKLPIDVRLNQEVTPGIARHFRPDVILVAVGARRELPAIPGIDRPNVLSGDDLRNLMTGNDKRVAMQKLSVGQRALLKMADAVGVSARITLTREFTKHWMPLGKRIAILGGGLVGVELAAFLSERGREVTILEEGKTPAPEMALPRRWRALYELRQHSVRLLAGVRVEEISDAGVLYSLDGERATVPADHVLVATGVRENRDLAERLAGLAPEIHLLGDCKEVGYIQGALMDAARIARAI